MRKERIALRGRRDTISMHLYARVVSRKKI